MHPNINSKELAINLKLSPSNCGNQVKKLQEYNLIYVTKSDRKKVFGTLQNFAKRISILLKIIKMLFYQSKIMLME